MLEDHELCEQQRIFMDEDDSSLYFPSNSKKQLLMEQSKSESVNF